VHHRKRFKVGGKLVFPSGFYLKWRFLGAIPSGTFLSMNQSVKMDSRLLAVGGAGVGHQFFLAQLQ